MGANRRRGRRCAVGRRAWGSRRRRIDGPVSASQRPVPEQRTRHDSNARLRQTELTKRTAAARQRDSSRATRSGLAIARDRYPFGVISTARRPSGSSIGGVASSVLSADSAVVDDRRDRRVFHRQRPKRAKLAYADERPHTYSPATRPAASPKDDLHGTNLPDVAAALSYAECKIVELRKESPFNDPALMMIVKDEARKMVLSLPLSSITSISSLLGLSNCGSWRLITSSNYRLLHRQISRFRATQRLATKNSLRVAFQPRRSSRDTELQGFLQRSPPRRPLRRASLRRQSPHRWSASSGLNGRSRRCVRGSPKPDIPCPGKGMLIGFISDGSKRGRSPLM
jgi:hypothetical protein